MEMKKNYLVFVMSLLIILFHINSKANSTELPGMRSIPLNLPDISVVGNFYSEISKENKNILNISEVEIAFQGYVYPNLYSNVIFSHHRDEFELEEAYLSFSNVFKGLSLEAGKRLLEFGKINKIHPHHRPYFDQPEVITSYLGEHGLSGVGYKIGYILPLNFFCQLMLAAYDIPQHLHSHFSEENHEHSFSPKDKGYFSKIWLSFPLSGVSELETGLNYLASKGPHFNEHKDEIELLGLDITYKYEFSTYRKLKLQTEIIQLSRNIPLGAYYRLGGYFYSSFTLSKYYSIGLRFDYLEKPEIHSEENFDEKESISSYSFIITRNLTETSFLRLQYKHKENDPTLYLQFVFGFGPHSHMIE